MLKASAVGVSKTIVFALVLLSYESSWADDIQLLYPDNNVSSKPILEFRARPPTGKPVSVGHTFVFLGRELDNGATVFYGVGGFYPENNTVKNLLYGPGSINYKIDDMKADQVFRVRISQDQEDLVKYILTNWETKTYAVAWQNCVSLQRDVARSIGLKVPEFDPKNIGSEIPSNFVEALRKANSTDAPIKFQPSEAKRMEEVQQTRAKEYGALKSTLEEKAKATQKRLDQIRRNPPGPPVGSGPGATGFGTSSGGSPAPRGARSGTSGSGGPDQSLTIELDAPSKRNR